MAMMTDTSEDFDFYARAQSSVTVQVLSKFDLEIMARDNDEIDKMMKRVDIDILRNGLPYCKFMTCYSLDNEYVDPRIRFQDAVNRVVMMNRFNWAKMFVNVVLEVRNKYQQSNMNIEEEVSNEEVFINESVNVELERKMDWFAKSMVAMLMNPEGYDPMKTYTYDSETDEDDDLILEKLHSQMTYEEK